uniref:ATP synthase complex subunit 8 n=1 Tax=Odontobutis obscura TaxID=86244 RepID=A0A0S1RU81_9GOBI|nr:ATP synthase subunit 8 [Odontobutis obscura]
MPQLSPAAWLMIWLFTWLVFITVLPPMVQTHITPNKLNERNTLKPKTEYWNWRW